jgi:hypothetical protein
MNRRTNILRHLRRWNAGAARYVVASFAAAYLSVGVAPCAAAASEPKDNGDAVAIGHEHADAAHSQHDHEGHGSMPADHETVLVPAERGSDHCPHCPSALEGAAAIAHGNDHSSCAALADLTNVAASHAKDPQQPLMPLFAPAAFTLPPPLASPLAAPPSRAVRTPTVRINVRHCVFLI